MDSTSAPRSRATVARTAITWNSVTTRGEVALQFARVVPGERPGATRVLERNALPIGLSAIAWDGREFGVSYPHYDARRDRVEARLLRASADGRALGTLALGDGPGMGGLFALTPAADGLAVSWSTLTEDGDAALWFARARGERVDVRARACVRSTVLRSDRRSRGPVTRSASHGPSGVRRSRCRVVRADVA